MYFETYLRRSFLLELYHVTFTYVVIGWLVMLNDISSDIICNNSTHVLLILLLDFVDNAQSTCNVSLMLSTFCCRNIHVVQN